MRKSIVVGTVHSYSSRIRRAFSKYWHLYRVLNRVDLARKKKRKEGGEMAGSRGRYFAHTQLALSLA